MNFLKTLDQALDFERLEKTVTEKVQQAALSVVQEFPDRHKATPVGRVLSITPAVLVETREVSEIWQAFEMEHRKDEWEVACSELKLLRGTEETSHTALQAWQRRAHDAEFKLYQLYSSLLALPDPAPFLYLLSSMAVRVQDLEDANRKLQAAADQAAQDDAEVCGLIEKHQRLLESTKELQDELARRDARIAEMSAAAAEAAVARQEVSIQAAEIARLQRSLKAVKDEYESTQQSLFELQSRLESLAGSRQQEAELATEELERVSKRAAELELQRQQLLSRLENAQHASTGGASGQAGAGGGFVPGSLAGGMGDLALLERQLAVREEQVTALSASLEAVQRSAADAASRHALEMATLRDQVAITKLALDRLEREVARRPDPKDYLELRQRAEALQSLVDVQMQAEGWTSEQVEATLRDPSPQTVTQVLQERSRKLSSEVNSLRRQVAERDKQIQDLESRISGLEVDLGHRAQLVAKLEEHLAAAASAASGTAPAVIATPLPAAGTSPDSSMLMQQFSGSLGVLHPGLDSAVGGQSGTAALAPPGASSEAPPAATGDGGSLLEIVISQRDRIRQRMLQLEEEKGQLSEELHKTRQQLQTTRNDNVALFEKVRYLERYNHKAVATGRTTVVRVDSAGVAEPSSEDLAAARGNRYQCGPFALEVGGRRAAAAADSGSLGAGGGGGGRYGPAGGGAGGPTGIRSRGARGRGAGSQVLACFGDGDDVEASNTTAEARAARAYEARVNPFAEFQQSEAELRVRNLQVHDRAVLIGSRLLLGSRVARIFFSLYTVMLHFIILLLMFYATTPCPAAAVLDPAAAAAAASGGLAGVGAGGPGTVGMAGGSAGAAVG